MVNALVIDDNREAADAVCQMLMLLGMQTRASYGPREAMLVLKSVNPDIVFVDINMPGVSGFEVVSYMRRYPQLENIPIVVITSDDQPETAKMAHDMGVMGLIVKPATVEELEEVCKKAGLI
jgi:CheY-like chemotaxis protein